MTTTPGRAGFGTATKVALAAEVAWTYCRVRLTFRGGDVRRALARLRDSAVRRGGRQPVPPAEAARLGWAVSRTLTAIPGDSRCLVQSLVLITMLARRRTPSTLVIGVRPGTDFAAHAWVEVEGLAVLPAGGQLFPRMTEL